MHFAAVVKNYVGKTCNKYISLLKKNCISDDDYNNNSEKLLQMLDDVGIVTHYVKKDLINISSRETLLFLF